MADPRPTTPAALPTQEPNVTAIFRRHGADVARWAARLGGPLVDPDDVVQEVFSVVERRLSEFRADAKLATWLYRITLNIASTRRRRERLRRWLRGLPSDYARDLPVEGPSVVEQMERREAAAEVYAALDLLPEKYRSVIILFEMEGLSGEEIAVLAGLPLGTVWVRLSRGRRQFRDHYERLLKKRGP